MRKLQSSVEVLLDFLNPRFLAPAPRNYGWSTHTRGEGGEGPPSIFGGNGGGGGEGELI